VFKKPQAGIRSSEEVLQGAYSQANIMKYVGHENIVTMYDAYFEADNLYVVMELCRGDDLFQWLCDRLQLQVKHGTYALGTILHIMQLSI
jgi:serine/threonine protein kinase